MIFRASALAAALLARSSADRFSKATAATAGDDDEEEEIAAVGVAFDELEAPISLVSTFAFFALDAVLKCVSVAASAVADDDIESPFEGD